MTAANARSGRKYHSPAMTQPDSRADRGFSYSRAYFEELVDSALAHAKKLGATDAGAEASEGCGLSVSVRKGELENVERNRDKSLGVTVYVGARRGNASTSDFSRAAIEQTVQAAYDIARFTAEDPAAGLPDEASLALASPGLNRNLKLICVGAGATGSVELLDSAANAARQSRTPVARMAAMSRVSGLVSWGVHQGDDSAVFPGIPVNGHGSFVAHVPIGGARAWFTGATYWQGEAATLRLAEGHDENLQRLAQLLPQVADSLTTRFAQAQVQAWSGARCTTIDRLPAVGALDAGPQPSLWVSTGFGSRGLTHAALCAELLAAQLGGEPLPVEASLAKCIAATRPQLLHHL